MNKFIYPALMLLASVAVSQSVLAKMYRWTDEQGNTHYSDKIPVDAIQGVHSTINKKGMTSTTRDAATTDEEYAREQERKRMLAAQKEELKRQQAKDRVLLRTFRTEDDIILSRDGKLATYDAQIRVVYDNISRLKQRLSNQQKRAAKIERKGKKLDKKTLDGMQNTRQEIKSSYESILRREHDKERIEKKYGVDLAQFRMLKQLQNSSLAPAETSHDKANVLVETAIECKDEDHCNSLWEKALAYGEAHATTPVYTNSERIFMTRPAITSQDISITISRIRPDKKGKEVVFMDVQCKKRVASATWCKNAAAQEIRDEFKAAMTQ